ncbi:MAG TPA: HD domain-containing protein [Candidatus Limnocylindrales bacterium]
MQDETVGSTGSEGEATPPDGQVHPQLWAVNLISDPIHGYIELTKRLTPEHARRLGLAAEEAAEGDLLDSAWLQRMRRISQLQSARWVFPTAEHSRFTHSLGVMHEAGLWARHLYPSLCAALAETDPAVRAPSEGLVVETLRLAGLLHDVGHGPFAHFFDEHVLCHFGAPADPRRKHKSLTHEDLSQLIIERELGEPIRAIRRAPGIVPERDALRSDESIDPAWLSFLISKPAIADPSMPRWLRWLQPLLSGVFTVDNLDYVRRDAYLIGVSTGPVDVERLRRYSFVGVRGLSIYEPGLGALEMFLTARLFMYQQIYYHRSVRAIDLDLAEVFRPSILAIFGDRSPADDLGHYADLDEYALLHQAALWARGEALSEKPEPGDGTVTAEVGRVWSAILLRRPRWRIDRELRRDYEAGERAGVLAAARVELGPEEAGRCALDLAEVDARPAEATATDSLLAVAGREGAPALPVSQALGRLPAYSLVARRFVRSE